VDNVKKANVVLAQLKKFGLSMNDFGTGYSEKVTYRFPLDTLKIDRSL